MKNIYKFILSLIHSCEKKVNDQWIISKHNLIWVEFDYFVANKPLWVHVIVTDIKRRNGTSDDWPTRHGGAKADFNTVKKWWVRPWFLTTVRTKASNEAIIQNSCSWRCVLLENCRCFCENLQKTLLWKIWAVFLQILRNIFSGCYFS